MRSASRLVVSGVLLAATPSLPGVALADDRSEPTYGRVEGDLTLVAGAGAVVAPRAPRVVGDLRVRYLESAGLFATYEDGVGSAAEPQRVLATGLEIRPLFFFRWLQGHEARRAFLDLVVDSFGLEVGAAFAQPAGEGFASRAGLQAGLGIELPLAGRASGPWIGLHGGVRWSDAALASGEAATVEDRSAFLSITLAWHQVVMTHVVDVGDEAPR